AKLDWMNREYIRMDSDDRMAERVAPFFAKAGLGDSPEMIRRAVIIEKQRMTTLKELPGTTAYLFADRAACDPAKIPGKKSTADVAKLRLAGLKDFLEKQPDGLFGDVKQLETAVLEFVARKGWTNAETLWPMRYALTGQENSPSPFEVAWALGKTAALGRIDDAIKALS
ncbi:MAG: hypothetical protein AAB692_05955, partial [Patescibacteria group bacterium]